MSRLILTLTAVLALVAAGCGDDDKQATATTPDDPGAEVMEAFVAAVDAGDAAAAWDLLSEPARKRVGPTVDDFEQGAFRDLEKTLAPFAGGSLPVEVSEKIDEQFGVVALSRGDDAYAVPLRLEGGHWRVELESPVEIDVLGPPPGSKGEFAKQIGVEKRGAGGAGIAVLYLDGITLNAETFADDDSATIFANFETKLEPGVHTAVAFTSAAGNAAARAWTFEP